MTDQPPPQPQQNQIRPSFHDDFYSRAEQAGRDMLMLIPELESVAIVPVWEPRQPTLPPGVIVGQSGQGLQTPAEFVHMAEQLHLTLKFVLEGSYAMLTAIDQRMGQMAQEIRDKEERLAELNAAIAEHETPPGGGDSAGGTAPSGPGPG